MNKYKPQIFHCRISCEYNKAGEHCKIVKESTEVQKHKGFLEALQAKDFFLPFENIFYCSSDGSLGASA